MLSDSSVKKRIEGLTSLHGKDEYVSSLKFLDSFMESIVGRNIVSLSKHFLSRNSKGFLLDFVSFAVIPACGLSFDDHVALVMQMMDTYNTFSGLELCPEDLFSPSSVLTFYWMHENMISHLFAVVSAYNEFASSGAHDGLRVPAASAFVLFLIKELAEHSSQDCTSKERVSIDFIVTCGVVKYFVKSLNAIVPSESSMISHFWLPMVAKVMEDVRMLLRLLICLSSSGSQHLLTEEKLKQDVSPAVPDKLSISHLLGHWWRLCSSFCLLKEITSNRESYAKVLGNAEANPLTCDNNVEMILELCDAENISPAFVLGNYINSFVLVELDFLKSCLPSNFYFVPISFQAQIYDFLLSCESPTAPKKENSTPDSDGELEIEDGGNEEGEQTIFLQRLHRIAVRMLKDDVDYAKTCISTDNSLPGDVNRAKETISFLSNICTFEANGKFSLSFYIRTIQFLLYFVENGGETRAVLPVQGVLSQLVELNDSDDGVLNVFAASPVENLMALSSTRSLIAELCTSWSLDEMTKFDGNDKLIDFVSNQNLPNIFFLKNVRKMGGNDALLDYMRQARPPVSFLPFTNRLESDKKIKLINPFLTMEGSDQFASAVSALGHLGASLDTLERWRRHDCLGLTSAEQISLVLAVFYHKVDSLTVDLQMFRGFIKKMATGDGGSEKLYLNVLQWLAKLPKVDLRPKVEMILEQLKVHAVIMATTMPTSIFSRILTNPSSLKMMYLPSMPRSEMEEVLAAYGNGVGW